MKQTTAHVWHGNFLVTHSLSIDIFPQCPPYTKNNNNKKRNHLIPGSTYRLYSGVSEENATVGGKSGGTSDLPPPSFTCGTIFRFFEIVFW